ncbi:MAG TPA: polymer-forming cytoskeletal protein [Candidatus Hydrogenedentes bacterium]|nr:polymer-forming cytoskeletal protein [Candidatus Hydrogenedentota bacterium]
MADTKNPQTQGGNAEKESEGGRKGLFGGWNSWLNDAIQTGRAPERKLQMPSQQTETPASAAPVSRDEAPAQKKPSAAGPGKMVIPEGVSIKGSLTGGPDTEISGHIDGDVTVEGRLLLGATARISGKIHAGSCRVDGQVEGPVECIEEVEVGKSGRLNAGVSAGKRISVAGQIKGSIVTTGQLRLVAGALVQGDIQARNLVIEEGAMFNGQCAMRTVK